MRVFSISTTPNLPMVGLNENDVQLPIHEKLNCVRRMGAEFGNLKLVVDNI